MPNSGTPRATQASTSASASASRALVVGLVLGMRLGAETGRMHVGAGAGQQDAVDRVQQRADIGDLRRAGKHQRQRAGDLGHRAQIAFADALRGEAVLDAGARWRSRRPRARFIAPLSLCSARKSAKRVVEPVERLLEDRARRREIEAQPGLAARPELRAGTGKDARAS